MNPLFGWVLALVLVIVGWKSYGLAGLALAASVIVFWLMLQFSRVMRVMNTAGANPIGRVGSAVMLTTKLRRKQQMVNVVQLTRSLGHRIDPPLDPNESEADSRRTMATTERETWAWTDDGDVQVHVVFFKGRVESWSLVRPEDSPAGAPADAPRDTSGPVAP
jgi:hypothetical protein